jgi:hypothetical protein
VPREIVIPVSRLSPLQAEAQFFGVLVEPLDLRARRKLIEAEYRLFEPALLHLELGSKHAAKLHKRAVGVIERERLPAAERARAHIMQAVAREHGAEGIVLREKDEKGKPVEIGPLTGENFGLWWLRLQRKLRGQPDNSNKIGLRNVQMAWANSKRVLHLALLVHETSRNCEPAVKPFGAAVLSEMFADPCAMNRLFDIAEEFRLVLVKVARGGAFELDEKETIRLIAA